MNFLWILLGLLFCVAGMCYLQREIRFIRRQKDLLIISYARLLACCTLGFIPAIMCLLYGIGHIELQLGNLVKIDYSSDGLFNLYMFFFLSIIAYVSLNLGYGSRKRIVWGRIRKEKTRFLEINEMQTFVVATMCMILGFFCLYLWTLNEGSITNFIVKANWYRADYTNSLENAYAMFKQPAKLVLVATYIFFFQMIRLDGKHRILFFIGYLSSLVISILYLLCVDGRLQIAMFFGVQLIGFILYRRKDVKVSKKQILMVGLLACLALILIAQLDNITAAIRGYQNYTSNTDENGIFMSLMQEFGYIYESGQKAIETNLFGNGKLMIADELVRGLFSCLPSRFTPPGFETVWRYNTFLCTGSESAGTIPCDIVAESIYDLGWFGVIILPFFIGKLMAAVEHRFSERKDNAFNRALYMGLVLSFFRLIGYCGMYDFCRGIFAYFIAWIISIAVRRLNFGRSTNRVTIRGMVKGYNNE